MISAFGASAVDAFAGLKIVIKKEAVQSQPPIYFKVGGV